MTLKERARLLADQEDYYNTPTDKMKERRDKSTLDFLAHLIEVRNEALEEAAMIFDSLHQSNELCPDFLCSLLNDIVNNIRSLKNKE